MSVLLIVGLSFAYFMIGALYSELVFWYLQREVAKALGQAMADIARAAYEKRRWLYVFFWPALMLYTASMFIVLMIRGWFK